MYSIECNPRLGSQILLFHTNENMGDIILGKHAKKNIEPDLGIKTYTALNDIFAVLDPEFYAYPG